MRRPYELVIPLLDGDPYRIWHLCTRRHLGEYLLYIIQHIQNIIIYYSKN